MSNKQAFEAIYQALAGLEFAEVVSYGELARRAGLPRRARLAGTALRQASASEGANWYRVVRADGSLAFPSGSEKHAEQRGLLEAEGVRFHQGKVDFDALPERAAPDADRALWGPPS